MWLRWRIWKQCQKDEQQKAGLLFRESSNDEKETESVNRFAGWRCYPAFLYPLWIFQRTYDIV